MQSSEKPSSSRTSSRSACKEPGGCTNEQYEYEVHDGSSPNPCVGKVFTGEMHHQSVDNDIPGDNVGLNIKGLDRNNMTRSSMKHTTLGQTKGLNKNNMLNAGLNIGSSSACSTASSQAAIDEQVLQRLPVVEEAIRLQLRTGASHLQKIEMAPEAYGIPRSSRVTLRKLRVDRNKALHVVGFNNLTESQNRYEGHDQKQILPPRKVNDQVFTGQMHHQRVDNDNPGDKAGLNIKCLDKNTMPTIGLDKNEHRESEVQKCLGDTECEECKAAWKCPNKDCGEQYFNEAMVDAADIADWGGPFCSECGYKLVSMCM